MKNILSIDGWYFRVFSKLANLVLLNLLFIVSIIPLVTIGIGVVALINSLQELREDGSLSAFKVYVTHFKKNISKGMMVLLIEGIGLLIPAALIYASLKFIPLLSTLIMILFSFLLLLLVIFPFTYSLNHYTIKEAIYKTLSFVTLKIAYAIAAFVIPLIVIFLSLKYSVIIMFLIGVALIMYLQLNLVNKAGIIDEN